MWNFLLAILVFPTACAIVAGIFTAGSLAVMGLVWFGAAVYVCIIYPRKKK